MTRSADKSILYLALTLFIGGAIILFSASMVLSYKNFGFIGTYAIRQFLSGGIVGGAALYACSRIRYRAWKKLALPLMLISFILLALLFIPNLGYSFGGARRWLKIGPVNFQPSELLKLSFIIYLASWLDTRRKDTATLSRGMIPFAIMLAVIAIFLVMQPDIGTLIVILITAGMMYILGGGKASQIAGLCLAGLVLFFLLIQMYPYQQRRLAVFLDPLRDPKGAGYHINQASIAIGSGGFRGLGFGKGLQKYHYLPEPMGDSIFAIFAEETGFLGTSILTGLFFALFVKGIAIARSAPDAFGKLLAAGISVGIMTQAFVNMAAISGLLPLTGIPLPFISYGSSSLAVTMASVGILLNISRYT
ncbi:MAG: putative lipid II flippase FtsW [Patescibacteria group bacterium]